MNSQKLFLFSIILLLFTVLKNSNAQWVQKTNGMGNQNVHSLTVKDNKIFAGTGNGVYLSTDYGENWVQVGFPGGTVGSLTTYGNIVFAGRNTQGIFKTTNDGESWLPTSLNQGSAGSFWISGDTIFAALWELNSGPTGVFMSTDSGDNWISIGLSGIRTRAVVGSGSYIFAGSQNNSDGVFKSTDKGSSWILSLSNEAIWTLKANGSNIYAGTCFNYDGLYISTNYGASWTQTSLNFVNVLSILLYGNNIIAGTGNQNGIYVSTDNGVSFISRNEGLINQGSGALCTLDNYIFAGTGSGGVYRRQLDELIPVELTTFTAAVQNEDVELSWSTATETNNQGFEVQRSRNNPEFITIGFVEGHGTTTEEHHYSFRDNDVSGILRYRLKQIDFDGSYEYSDVVEVSVNVPIVFSLEQNYPNPFNPSTKIRYSIPKSGQVKLSVFNLLGEEVAVLVNEVKEAGFHEATFNAYNLPSGTYFCKIENGGLITLMKMILMK